MNVLYKCTKWRSSSEEIRVDTSGHLENKTYLSQQMELLIKELQS